METRVLAEQMMAECLVREQAVRSVRSDAAATEVRGHLRAVARKNRIRIRTARIDDTVVVVLCSAALWTQSTAIMRSKLTPTA